MSGHDGKVSPHFTVVIGDIHGHSDKLDQLLSEVSGWSKERGQQARHLFVGDYIDRGPDSKGVLNRVRRMQTEGAICLRGNHEQMMIDATSDEAAMQHFLLNGGSTTIQSLATMGEFVEAQEWMSTLPTFFEDDLRYYVHAGINPRQSLSEQDDRSRLWIRETFLRWKEPFPKYVVHGHTPTTRTNPQQLSPEIRENRCNVDTGAGKGGPLSAAIFSRDVIQPVHTISVA